MSDKPLTEGKTRGQIKPFRKGSNPLPTHTRPPPPPSPPSSARDDSVTDRLKRLCDDLERSAEEMTGSSPYHVSVRVAVGIVSNAIRKEFLK